MIELLLLKQVSLMDDYSLKEGFLKAGSVVIFPTDTVYGLACRLYDELAVKRILKIKKRTQAKHFAVLCDILVTVNDLAVLDVRALKLAHSFWPGPLTLILPSSKSHYKKTGEKTIGVRIPNHNGVISLIQKNGPLITTSVNLSGEEPISNYQEIKKLFAHQVDYIYQEEQTSYSNISSTTVDLTNKEVKILREGTINKKQIDEVLKED